MEVGQGPNLGCSVTKKNSYRSIVFVNYIFMGRYYIHSSKGGMLYFKFGQKIGILVNGSCLRVCILALTIVMI
jgi:hypothetical protein